MRTVGDKLEGFAITGVNPISSKGEQFFTITEESFP